MVGHRHVLQPFSFHWTEVGFRYKLTQLSSPFCGCCHSFFQTQPFGECSDCPACYAADTAGQEDKGDKETAEKIKTVSPCTTWLIPPILKYLGGVRGKSQTIRNRIAHVRQKVQSRDYSLAGTPPSGREIPRKRGGAPQLQDFPHLWLGLHLLASLESQAFEKI